MDEKKFTNEDGSPDLRKQNSLRALKRAFFEMRPDPTIKEVNFKALCFEILPPECFSQDQDPIEMLTKYMDYILDFKGFEIIHSLTFKAKSYLREDSNVFMEHEHVRQDRTNFLILAINQCKDLGKCLEAYFKERETNPNELNLKLNPSIPRNVVIAYESPPKSDLILLPEILLFQLQRGLFHKSDFTFPKDTEDVDIPQKLILPQFLQDIKEGRYLLHSAIVHRGGDANFGHYITFVCPTVGPTENGLWIRYDDNNVTTHQSFAAIQKEIQQALAVIYLKQNKVNDIMQPYEYDLKHDTPFFKDLLLELLSLPKFNLEEVKDKDITPVFTGEKKSAMHDFQNFQFATFDPITRKEVSHQVEYQKLIGKESKEYIENVWGNKLSDAILECSFLNFNFARLKLITEIQDETFPRELKEKRKREVANFVQNISVPTCKKLRVEGRWKLLSFLPMVMAVTTIDTSYPSEKLHFGPIFDYFDLNFKGLTGMFQQRMDRLEEQITQLKKQNDVICKALMGRSVPIEPSPIPAEGRRKSDLLVDRLKALGKVNTDRKEVHVLYNGTEITNEEEFVNSYQAGEMSQAVADIGRILHILKLPSTLPSTSDDQEITDVLIRLISEEENTIQEILTDQWLNNSDTYPNCYGIEVYMSTHQSLAFKLPFRHTSGSPLSALPDILSAVAPMAMELKKAAKTKDHKPVNNHLVVMDQMLERLHTMIYSNELVKLSAAFAVTGDEAHITIFRRDPSGMPLGGKIQETYEIFPIDLKSVIPLWHAISGKAKGSDEDFIFAESKVLMKVLASLGYHCGYSFIKLLSYHATAAVFQVIPGEKQNGDFRLPPAEPGNSITVKVSRHKLGLSEIAILNHLGADFLAIRYVIQSACKRTSNSLNFIWTECRLVMIPLE